MKKNIITTFLSITICIMALFSYNQVYSYSETNPIETSLSAQQKSELIAKIITELKSLKAYLESLNASDAKSEFCYGDVMEITWDKNNIPSETVDILLTTPQTTLRLDTMRTEKGSYVWQINKEHTTTTGQKGYATIEPGDLYKIRLQISSGQAPASNRESMFEISACNN